MSPPKCKKGTKEWSAMSFNLQNGCENNCLYCYARRIAVRFNRVPAAGWDHPKSKPMPKIRKYPGVVMFPTTHDITPANMHRVLDAIAGLLLKGNQLLIVSKPHFSCIKYLVEQLSILDEIPEIEFRFSIGSRNDNILHNWEPNAPSWGSRIESLYWVLDHGFKVSVSCEPLLDPTGEIVDYLLRTTKNVQIWIGAMNGISKKIAPKLDYQALYEKYRENPRIQWKESFRKHLGGSTL